VEEGKDGGEVRVGRAWRASGRGEREGEEEEGRGG